jgi:DNA-binding transcriptional MerR regulator
VNDAGPAVARDRLLSIGAFARRSRLSVKALRLYDSSGLLVPADVDPRTGYRRYRESQLLSARLIVMMRRVGIPLTLVASIIAAPGAAGADLLAAYWTDAERRFTAQRDLVARLRASLLSGPGLGADGSYDIRQRDVPGQLVLTEQRHLRITELKRWLPGAIVQLAEAARRCGGVSGELFVIYHGEVNEDSDGPVEACAPIPLDTPPADLPVPARPEPAHREAYVTITKAQLEFPQILSAYDAVADWVSSSGLAYAGPPREVYLRDVDIAAAAPADPVCHIAYPIRPQAPIWTRASGAGGAVDAE